ncbi:hypothetical protein H9649_12005 [Sporosarcina sp. Sa2YVA2]|uniref:Uncharacterized protein n=1 Tax=Sporosarcina quadrami TaxID=2762234 RepID=A0ABR8UBA2_9BACL|nr:hypothetical protein [Sporosarcina quadrami]MBD7985313.1 hypothetical protein [Sporosarcina quadrami]
MNYEKHMKSSIAFFRSMAEKNRGEEKTNSDFQEGHTVGAAIAWDVAANHLEALLRWEGK